MTASRSLLLEIARCANLATCRSTPNAPHPCRAIVAERGVRDDHQIPEPWNGSLETAPILFISSNPSISFDEHYPDDSWTDEAVVEFFDSRFGKWMKDGVYGLRKDGSRGRAVQFNSAMRMTAERLLERKPRPGVDYCFTEVVHCKSKKEAGVVAAQSECSHRYLGRILAASGARITVVVGKRARESVAVEVGLSLEIGKLVTMARPHGSSLMIPVPHPGDHAPSRIDRILSAADLDRARAILR